MLLFYNLMENFNESLLESIKDSIDKMDVKHHVSILRILKSNDKITLNENMNGFYINLSFLPPETIEEIEKYIIFISEQEKSLTIVEDKKRELSFTLLQEVDKDLIKT